MRGFAALVTVVGLLAAGCGWKPSGMAPPPPDTCKASDGPTAQTVQQAIAAVPAVTPTSSGVDGSAWVEIARGHTRNCRLYWVQVIPSIATESSPQQLLFFDHNTRLGSPTPNPKPYTTVMSSDESAVRVQYQWRVGDEEPCCPTGIGSVRYQIGSDGKLQALGPIPHQ